MSAPLGQPTVPASRKNRWKYASSFNGLEDRPGEPRPEVNRLFRGVIEGQVNAVTAPILRFHHLGKDAHVPATPAACYAQAPGLPLFWPNLPPARHGPCRTPLKANQTRGMDEEDAGALVWRRDETLLRRD